jgi:hypothetical protein
MISVSAGGSAAQTGQQVARNSELISKLKSFNLKPLAEELSLSVTDLHRIGSAINIYAEDAADAGKKAINNSALQTIEMGGCSDGRRYPPTQLAAITKACNDLDPSLAYDVSAYGH